MKYVFGVLFILAGVALGLYVGLYVLFIGGVVSIVDGIKAEPTDAGSIAWGIVKMFCAGGVGGAIFWGCAIVGAACFVIEDKPRIQGGTAKQVEARWRDITK